MSRLAALSLAVCLLAIPAIAQVELAEEHLELVDDLSTSVDDDGEVVISITVRNTHPALSMFLVSAHIAAMRDGLVVGYVYFSCGRLDPGATAQCSKGTGLTEEEYEELTFGRISFGGLFSPLDESMIIGRPIVVEESLNCRPDRNGYILFLGEVLNDTNAILNIWSVRFHLYDDKDRYLGMAEDRLWAFSFEYVKPQETFLFAVTNEDISFAKVDHWVPEISYKVEKIFFEEGIPTAVEQATWGQIKAQGRGQ